MAPDPQKHDIHVRGANESDCAELTRMHLAAGENLLSAPKGAPLAHELLRGDEASAVSASFASALDDPESSVFLGLLGEVPVGYSVLVPDLGRGRIRELWVDPEARAIGVGGALLQSVRNEASRRRMTGLDSVALPGDRNTKNFFEDHALVARAIVVGTSEL